MSRLDAVEAKLVFAEDLLETLNLTVYRQQQRSSACTSSWGGSRSSWPATRRLPRPRNLKDEIPPHY